MNEEKKNIENNSKAIGPVKEKYGIGRIVLSIFFYIIVVALGLLIIYFVLKYLKNLFSDFTGWLRNTLSGLDSVVVVALVSATVSLISVLFTSVISKIIEYKQKRRDYLNQKREKSYGQFVDMYYKIMQASNGSVEYTPDEMLEDISLFSKELTLWGSNKVVKRWIEFRLKTNKEPWKSIDLVEKLLFAIRKDMGFRKMKKGTLLKMIINDYDEYKKKINLEK